MIHNWAGNVTFSTDRLARPRTVGELQELVAGTPRLRALGTGHSFNTVADSDGLLVNLEALDIPTSLDTATGTVRVAGGVRYGELAAVVQEQGRALPNLGSLPHIAVAGACATGTHGSGVGNQCLAAAAVGVEFVRGDGELVTLTDADPDFRGSVLALGALGIVTSLTLATRPSFDLRQDVWLDAPLERVLEDFDAVMSAGYSVSLFLESGRPEIVDKIWIKSTPEADPVDASRWGATAAESPQHPIGGIDPNAATEQLGVPGPWNARLPHFRMEFTPSNGDEQQSEWFVAREHGADALAAVAALDLAPALQVSEIRAIAADDLWLSPFRGQDRIALHFTWLDDDRLVHDAVAAVEHALAPFAARPHWGKVFHEPPTPDGLAQFRTLAAANDPERRFGNRFLEKFVYGTGG